MQVYVHPIPPVLDVTRKMVIRYNTLYKEAVKGIKGERCCCFAVLLCCTDSLRPDGFSSSAVGLSVSASCRGRCCCLCLQVL
jgi:hypothetical protein